MTCAELRELAPDLALGLALGPERAEAIDHLEACASCRALVDDLSRAADGLLLLAPVAEPRRGFENRVLTRLGDAGAASAREEPMAVAAKRWRRRAVLAGVAAMVSLLALAGVLLVRGVTSPGEEQTTADMITPRGREVGEAYLFEEERWVLLSLPGWTQWVDRVGSAKEYRLRMELVDGRHSEVALPGLTDGRDAWGRPVPVDIDRLARIAVVDERGREWCGATLEGN